jgi:hypothetical protein
MIAEFLAVALTHQALLGSRINVEALGREVVSIAEVEGLLGLPGGAIPLGDHKGLGRKVVARRCAGVFSGDTELKKRVGRIVQIGDITFASKEERHQRRFKVSPWKDVRGRDPLAYALIPLVDSAAGGAQAKELHMAGDSNSGDRLPDVFRYNRSIHLNFSLIDGNTSHNKLLHNPRPLIGLGDLSGVLKGLVVSVGAVAGGGPSHSGEDNRSEEAGQSEEAERSLPDADAYRLLASYDRSYSDDVCAALFVGIGGALLGCLLGFRLFLMAARDAGESQRHDAHKQRRREGLD